MTVIDKQGTRVREWCAECAAYHKAENCKRARDRRRRARRKSAKWFADMIAYRDFIAAQRADRRAETA